MNFILIILAALLCASAFFSACETAFMSLNSIKLKSLAARGNKREAKRASLALNLLENYDKLISSILIGNNVVNIASSGLAALFFVRLLGDAGVSVATLVMTALVLVFGEITPKTLAREAPEKFAVVFAPLLKFFIIVFSPFTFLSVQWKKFITKIFKISSDRSITEAELLTFVEEARSEGGINEREETMIKRTIDFDERTARDICTPRIDIAAVSINSSVKQIDECFSTTRFSRLPVYDDSIDNIVGILLYKDFRYEVLGGSRTIKNIMKNVVYVPQAMKAPRLLKTMQENKSHLAVVLDEFGGTTGIVTIEDIVEELVGEIWDEHDEVIENISLLSGGRTRILGRASLPELFDYYHILIDEKNDGQERGDLRGSSPRGTLATWILEHSGSDVHSGDVISFYGVPLTISKIHHGRVMEAYTC